MKRIANLLGLLSALLIALTPAAVANALNGTSAPPLAPVLITEVQAGSSASSSEEFIELYNTTAQPIDLAAHSWQLEIASSSATSWNSPYRTIPLSGMITSGQHLVIASQYTSAGQTTKYLSDGAAQWFSAGIAATAGHVRLSYQADQVQNDSTCGPATTVVDEIEWSAPKSTGGPVTPSLDGRSAFITDRSTGLPAGSSLQRLVDPTRHVYVDTNSDAVDFAVSPSPTPLKANTLTAAVSPPADTWQVPAPLPVDTCDPALASTAAAGVASSLQPPADSPPSLGSSTSPNGASSAPPSIPAADNGLLGPQISELLPNPAPPQTDASDEFIELYNPNNATFDLGGFALVTTSPSGAAHQYVIPGGIILAPQSFTVFSSSATKLSLSNSGGRVALLDLLGATVMQTDVYGTAKDGQAWILANGRWQWTTKPTPGSANVVESPPASKKAQSKTGTVKSASTVKKAAAKAKSQTGSATPTADVTAKTPSSSPLHPAILAAVACLALLYGAYEYRTDAANYIRKRRDYRAARREARHAASGRGGD
ncbi:MAG TPA: lamin tail domain-containing protein [Candidatus Saccharimonadales bacterium]|nr:lamin tail domain-containing protein [Candidatus Saccharimonadales bacterium]